MISRVFVNSIEVFRQNEKNSYGLNLVQKYEPVPRFIIGPIYITNLHVAANFRARKLLQIFLQT